MPEANQMNVVAPAQSAAALKSRANETERGVFDVSLVLESAAMFSVDLGRAPVENSA
jgi:hypothetical protein